MKLNQSAIATQTDNLIMIDYRYLKDRNADLESTLSFYYPED